MTVWKDIFPGTTGVYDESLFGFAKKNAALHPMGIRFSGGIRTVFDADGFAWLIQNFLSLHDAGSDIGKSPFNIEV